LKITLIALHFAEYAARLAISLSRDHSVQLHLSGQNAANELSSALLTTLKASVELHMHPPHTRKYMLIHGAHIAILIRRFSPDIIHAQEAAAWTLWSTLIQLFPRRAKFVLTVHDPSPHMGSDTHIRRRTEWANRRLRLLASAVLVHGQHSIDDIKQILPQISQRVYSVEHGVLGDMHYEATPKLNISFLFFGRIQAYKGLGVFIEAAHILKAKKFDFQIKIAGNGPDLEPYRDIISQSDFLILEDRYIPETELAALFGGATAVVMPYLEATQSGVAALAISAQKPLIASSVGSIPEVIKHEMNGLLVPPNQPVMLAEAMERLITDTQLCLKLSEGAALTAQTTLNWDKISEHTVRIYDKIRA
jgi:glycosyltransferase involved in cell wall biosynthesis